MKNILDYNAYNAWSSIFFFLGHTAKESETLDYLILYALQKHFNGIWKLVLYGGSNLEIKKAACWIFSIHAKIRPGLLAG